MNTNAAAQLELTALRGIPLIKEGDSIAAAISESLRQDNLALKAGDVLVVAQKIVSKAEGRIVDLADVSPSEDAIKFAQLTSKDPRLVELILAESTEVIRHRPGVLIVSHRSGVVMANAGIDRSNVSADSTRERVLLLPKDSDLSAAGLRADLESLHAVRLGVIVCDSVGRAWRNGTCGLALGASGLRSLDDLRGAEDLFGRPLQVSTVGTADQIAAAAQLLMGEADEGLPAVVVRGLDVVSDESQPATSLVRDPAADLFR